MKQPLIVLIALVMTVLSVSAAEDSYDFDSDSQRAAFLNLTAELRCPMCQNQNIADSDAMIAHDMRRKVYQLVKQGKSEQEVIVYMKERYGDFVHYQPPVNAATMWLWLLPVLFVVFAATVVVMRRKANPPEDMAAKLAQAESMLEQEK